MEPTFLQSFPAQADEVEHAALIDAFRAGITALAVANPALFEPSAYYQEALVSARFALRFLIARALDVDKAVAMFGEAVALRDEKGIDAVLDARSTTTATADTASEADAEAAKLEADVRKLNLQFPHCWHGFDAQGRPLYIDFLGKLDAAALTAGTSFDAMLAYHWRVQEFTRRKVCALASQRAGRRIDQTVAVVDLGGVGRKQMNSSIFNYLKAIAKSDQLVYPESSCETHIINAGMLFSAAFAVVKPFLDKRTTDKFRIYSNVPDLCAMFGAENVPAFYGGSYKPTRYTDIVSDTTGLVAPRSFPADSAEGVALEAKVREACGGDDKKTARMMTIVGAPLTERKVSLLFHGQQHYLEHFQDKNEDIGIAAPVAAAAPGGASPLGVDVEHWTADAAAVEGLLSPTTAEILAKAAADSAAEAAADAVAAAAVAAAAAAAAAAANNDDDDEEFQDCD